MIALSGPSAGLIQVMIWLGAFLHFFGRLSLVYHKKLKLARPFRGKIPRGPLSGRTSSIVTDCDERHVGGNQNRWLLHSLSQQANNLSLKGCTTVKRPVLFCLYRLAPVLLDCD